MPATCGMMFASRSSSTGAWCVKSIPRDFAHSLKRKPNSRRAAGDCAASGFLPNFQAKAINPAKASATPILRTGEGVMRATPQSIPPRPQEESARVSRVSSDRAPADLLVLGASEIATPLGNGPRGGAELGAIRVLKDGAIAIARGKIVAVGTAAELGARFQADRELDAAGGTIVPGFVDAHTHPVFAGTRENEFEMRTHGASYVEIAERGGGILSSVRGVRAASAEELLERLLGR